MSASAISRRYAKALVELGADQGKIGEFGQELAGIKELLEKEGFLRQILESPTFPLEKKSALLADLNETLQLSTGMRSFLGLLLEKDRLKYLGQIEAKFRAFADERSGVLRARITSAAKIKQTQQTAIKSTLEKLTGKAVELTLDENPELIGGLRAEVGGRVFDGSVRTQLKRIEESLTKG